ncbi:TPA: hypothetical protein QC443_005893, partial [Bacillus cereus]|uniref:YopX family protein n=1 Tax=Bacillus cereus TaxID=1396 RepID=UPI001926A96A|nr:YopX family protein [Bacillus cereus]MBL3881110.1 hypothetical protein [Bacillus cereus]HDR8076465.1 hypothetical protein [Bacillus cereus]HDR8206656.1 hypothetical protein [Bacillus cereus]HDR8212686.1 hypothetical protein [Bacillus cereus]HDR8223076.1 hypothetical protein [Bacillus cereus]
MREIKFRVWSNFYNDWIESFCIKDGRVHLGNVVHYPGNQVSDAILMQYTGLKDKNGKEIYEGDILGDDNYSNVDGAVVFNEEKGYYEIDKFNYEPLHESLKDYDFEVLGNIYENSELLEN